MVSILQSEWYKLRKTNIEPILFAGPLVGAMVGWAVNFNYGEIDINNWLLMLVGTNFTYALLFLPLITGVLASLICRYEHQAGGWKQLLALPVTRGKVFVAKFIVLIILVLVIQLLYLAAILLVGKIKGFTDPFPMIIIFKSIIGGWVATFPLVALQLGLSVYFKSFAAPFAVNVIFTLPSILVVNSEKFGPYYPWAQPFLMLYTGDNNGDIFFVPWEQLLLVVGVSFIVFFLAGYIYFQKRAV